MVGHCFNNEERKELEKKGWTKKQVEFAEGSIIEANIKKMIK